MKEKEAKSTTEENRSRSAKKLAKQRRERVVDFLCHDENSRLLPGSKDTVTKKQKQKTEACAS